MRGPNSRKLDILYVAYPLLPVSSASGGGAEQMLWLLEREMHRRGHRTTVACCAGSRVSGELAITSPGAVGNDGFELCNTEHIANVCALVRARRNRGEAFDLVHDESGSFWIKAAKVATQVLATLHLPRDFYPRQAWQQVAANVSLNCVSHAQERTLEAIADIAGVVPNGIDLERYRCQKRKGDYILWLGRLCQEKGAHIALDVAQQADMKLVIAGTLYPFSYHQEYCEKEVLPRLQRANGKAILVDSPAIHRKIRLLQKARVLLVPSLAEETSSLVAMEAMACGTPVIALRRGALAEVVTDGTTGFIVDSEEEMRRALSRIGEIDSRECRRRAEEHFDGARMCDEYERLYGELLSRVERFAA